MKRPEPMGNFPLNDYVQTLGELHDQLNRAESCDSSECAGDVGPYSFRLIVWRRGAVAH